MTGTGRMLGGRYRLIGLLATGGMGQVWRARDTLLDRPVAVKVLRSEYTGDATFRSRFRAEAQHSAGLAHPNIATLFDYGESTLPEHEGEQVAYLVMELVEGEPLSAVLQREGRVTPARTLDILRQTAAALAAAHSAGLIHRDVKPGNVLLGDDGVVRITDFGIAWSASSVPLTRTGQVVGTPHYLAPEQAAGERARPASDVYALGLIGYECLAGRRAFVGENAVQIALRQMREEPDPLPDDVPDDVRTLIGRALLKDPAHRFVDGAAFLSAIEDVQAGRPLDPLPPRTDTWTFLIPGGDAPEEVPPARRRLSGLLLPAAALAAGLGIAFTGLQLAGSPAVPPASADAAVQSGVVLAAGDYVGRSVDEVEAELGALGLQVERQAAEDEAVPAGQVLELSPSGALRPGDLVVVTYAVAASPPPVAPTPPPVPVPVAVPVPVEAPPASTEPVVDAPAPQPAPPPAPQPNPGRAGGSAGDGGGPQKDGVGNGKAKGKSKGRGRG